MSPTLSTILQSTLVIIVLLLLAYVLYTRYYSTSTSTTRLLSTPSPPPSSTTQSSPPSPSATLPQPPSPTPDTLLFEHPPPTDPSRPPFYHKPNDLDRAYPPVWVPVDSSMAKVLRDYRPANGGDDGCGWCVGPHTTSDGVVAALPRSQLPPDFADVFRGYQRLALLSLHLAFGRYHKIMFVHKGNWHRLVPQMTRCASTAHLFADTLDDQMRLDYVKSHVLATYGGYWFPPDTLVVRGNIHDWMHEDILPGARAQPLVPLDTPLLVVGGIREVQHESSTEWFKDDSVLFAEPRNPVMMALAQQMHRLANAAPTHSDYDHRNWFTKALHVYSSPQLHGELARSVVILPPSATGAVDDTLAPVTAEHYFRQRPIDHLPHPDTHWFVVDTPDRRITSYPRYEWFAYLTEEAIVQSTLWVSMLYRRALGMEHDGSREDGYIDGQAGGKPGYRGPQQGTFRRSVALGDAGHPLRLGWTRSWTADASPSRRI